jgi:thiol-disulfide isomerase/thioredoxin
MTMPLRLLGWRVWCASVLVAPVSVVLGAARLCAASPTHGCADTVVDRAPTVPPPPLVAVGDTVNFGFTDLDGHHHTLAEFRGTYVLLDIWGTWCRGCRVEMQRVIETYKTYHGRGFEIIGISNEDVYGTPIPGDSVQAAFLNAKADKAWKLYRKLPWPQTSTLIAQRPGEDVLALITRLGSHGYPYHVLIDPAGRLLENDQAQLSGTALDMLLDRRLPEETTPAASENLGKSLPPPVSESTRSSSRKCWSSVKTSPRCHSFQGLAAY